jgi:hypothetical protein
VGVAGGAGGGGGGGGAAASLALLAASSAATSASIARTAGPPGFSNVIASLLSPTSLDNLAITSVLGFDFARSFAIASSNLVVCCCINSCTDVISAGPNLEPSINNSIRPVPKALSNTMFGARTRFLIDILNT